MIEESLEITFLSAWHCGSGLGESHLADAVLNRDSSGLPVITGRTLKGALREGSWRLGMPDVTEYLWGSPSSGGAVQQQGRISVATGVLPEDVRQYLLSLDRAERDAQVELLVDRRARTALRGGTVVDGSLRTIECGIPGLCFQSSITLDVPRAEESWYRAYMRAACAVVKSIGANRARGLGSCVFKFGRDTSPVKLPSRRPS